MDCVPCQASMTTRDSQLDCHAGCLTIGGLHQNTVQRSAYEVPGGRSIGPPEPGRPLAPSGGSQAALPTARSARGQTRPVVSSSCSLSRLAGICQVVVTAATRKPSARLIPSIGALLPAL